VTISAPRPYRFRPSRVADAAAITRVVTDAFGGAEEAALVERLRSDGDILVELVAEEEAGLVGHILFSRLELEGPVDRLPAAALAPVSVRPGLQQRGVGGELIRQGLDACRDLDVPAVIVLGHPAYYPRFGFDAALTRSLQAPFSGPAFMALELRAGVLSSPRRARYASAFGLGRNTRPVLTHRACRTARRPTARRCPKPPKAPPSRPDSRALDRNSR
jgi:putative acetyltransferase